MTLGSHQACVGKSQDHITPRWIIDRLGSDSWQRFGREGRGRMEIGSALPPVRRRFVGMRGAQHGFLVERTATSCNDNGNPADVNPMHCASAGPAVTLNGVVSDACCQKLMVRQVPSRGAGPGAVGVTHRSYFS